MKNEILKEASTTSEITSGMSKKLNSAMKICSEAKKVRFDSSQNLAKYRHAKKELTVLTQSICYARNDVAIADDEAFMKKYNLKLHSFAADGTTWYKDAAGKRFTCEKGKPIHQTNEIVKRKTLFVAFEKHSPIWYKNNKLLFVGESQNELAEWRKDNQATWESLGEDDDAEDQGDYQILCGEVELTLAQRFSVLELNLSHKLWNYPKADRRLDDLPNKIEHCFSSYSVKMLNRLLELINIFPATLLDVNQGIGFDDERLADIQSIYDDEEES